MKHKDSTVEALDTAAVNGLPIPQLHLDIDEVGAYALQKDVVQRRLDRGERVTGFKMGLTSLAKMAQVGIEEPIMGFLTDAMSHEDGGSLDFRRLIHPRAEPELAFRLSRDVAEELDDAAARDAFDAVAAAIDILDSRYAEFKFNLADGIADNCSSSVYAVGAWQPVPEDLSGISMRLEIDGETVESGSSDQILGHPVSSLVYASRLAARHRRVLKRGQVFLTGAATAAAPLRPGTAVRAVAEGIGACTLKVGG